MLEEDFKLFFIEALENGEIPIIRYHGGSQPGKLRHIDPKTIGNDRVRAKCLNSNGIRTFLYNKIEIIDDLDQEADKRFYSPKPKKGVLGRFLDWLFG
jgi:predicted DNA-binding transcriptional regulator YafY